jgi:uncharacterized cupredoxin-like copper-binding protein
MRPLSLFPVFALAFAASLPAFGHDGPHTQRRAFDPAKVQETPFGRAGDPKHADVVIQVRMSDNMRFTPSAITVKRGQTVKFVVDNEGKLLHEMVLGTPQELKKHAELMRKFPDMQHEDSNMAHVSPGKTGEIVWRFTKAGEYAFACLQPGHYEAGMVGTVSVK